jgi:LDH2 family malate/lactate/ureidoglycolate dehydrogenase
MTMPSMTRSIESRATESRSMRVPESLLRRQTELILQAWGLPAAAIECAVDALVWADLRGIASHGIAMLPIYEKWRHAGRFDPQARPSLLRELPALAVYDAGSGFGFEPSRVAMRKAIDLARASGLAAVSVRRSNHFGAAGHWAEMASDAGLIGVAMTSTVSPSIVPTGGRVARLGTNPIAFAAPGADSPPFLLDMATSTVALGKLMVAALEGRPIPAGWALGPDGQTTADPQVGYDSRLATPLGALPELSSHKGYGLSVMVEILSAVLSGSLLSFEDGGDDTRGNVGHFFMAIDPRAFRDDNGFSRHLDRLTRTLRDTAPLDPDQPVRVAGDPERDRLALSQSEGVALAATLVDALRALCARASCACVLA